MSVITMHAAMLSVVFVYHLVLVPSPNASLQAANPGQVNQRSSLTRHLAAVRGEIRKIAIAGKGSLLITVRPAKDFQEVTVLARENDLVGTAVGRSSEPDLLGLLSDNVREDETITAAELNEGDVVSVIYDPQLQNKVIEIYLH